MQRHWLWTLAISLTLQALPALGRKPPPQSDTASSSLRFAGTQEFRVRTEWKAGMQKKSQVTLTTPKLAKPIELFDGKTVRADVAGRSGSALVAMIHGGSAPFVRFSLVDLSVSPPKANTVKVARPNDAERRPASVVATSDPKGFTVLWQEESTKDPSLDVRTYFVRVSPSGSVIEKPKVVNVPWALAAIAHNGHGYHLALYYDGAKPGETRLAMVTLSTAGEPEQHPWWASAPGDIADVQLLHAGTHIAAYFRGGKDATELFSTDVTAVGQWGQEPAAAKSRGKLDSDAAYAVKPDGSVVKRSVGDLG